MEELPETNPALRFKQRLLKEQHYRKFFREQDEQIKELQEEVYYQRGRANQLGGQLVAKDKEIARMKEALVNREELK